MRAYPTDEMMLYTYNAITKSLTAAPRAVRVNGVNSAQIDTLLATAEV